MMSQLKSHLFCVAVVDEHTQTLEKHKIAAEKKHTSDQKYDRVHKACN